MSQSKIRTRTPLLSDRVAPKASTDKPQYSIFLPTYNEAENLPLILFLIDKHLAPLDISYEVIIVDDGPPGNKTREIALEIIKKKAFGPNTANKIYLHPRSGKLGLGSAYPAAMNGNPEKNIRGARGDYFIIMDADLSHHPKFIPQMIATMKSSGADIVTGTRYRDCRSKGIENGVYGWNTKRKFVSRGANYLSQFLLQPGVSDLTGSFRLYTRDSFAKLMQVTKSRGYAFQMEIMCRATRQLGFKIAEVDITFVDRIYGESKLGATEIVQFIQGILLLLWQT